MLRLFSKRLYETAVLVFLKSNVSNKLYIYIYTNCLVFLILCKSDFVDIRFIKGKNKMHLSKVSIR